VCTLDRDGSIGTHGSTTNVYFSLCEKDPFLRECVKKHLGNAGNDYKGEYQISYKEYGRLLDN
jgi:hypothetical protein